MTERRPADRQRIRDAAIVLPFVATLLIMPPLIGLFAVPVALGGIPLVVVYVFAVWAAIILGAFILARRLPGPPPEPLPEEPPAGGGAH